MRVHSRSRRAFLKAVGLGAASLAIRRGARAAAWRRPPNVVLVMTDDQGYGDLACHGNPIIRTPSLDRLHARSVRLTNFHVSPTCSPTRSALLTGRYNNRTGVWHTIMGRSLLRRDEATMGDVFGASGYRTAVFGKWHLGDNFPFRPQYRGFQESVVNGGGGVGQTPDYWGNDYFDDTYLHNGQLQSYRGYCTDVFFAEAIRFIEANRDRPFFVYLPTNAAHGPYHVADRYRALYLDTGAPNPNFYGMITNIDENMDRLQKRLGALGLEENTILIFMTDNGTAAGFRRRGGRAAGYNAGMRGTKGSEYDGGHRVPCFIHWPAGGLVGGRDIGRLTAHIDLLPTLIDLCGLKRPDVAFDGASLVPLLRGGAWPDRTLVVDSQRIEHPETWRKSAVMTDRWRLVDGTELYDTTADPGQRRDVARANPRVVARLRGAYEGWWEDISARFDEYCEIVIGSEAENPTRITCHDWHGREVPWSQGHIRNPGFWANGFWAIDIARDGVYTFTLRRWPEEEARPIGASRARLRIGGRELEQPVAAGAESVTFRVPLRAGKTRLETSFTYERGKARGAYYVHVKRLEA